MRKFYASYITFILLIVVFNSKLAAQTGAACDNEDFEAGPAGPITVSTGIQGWTAYKMASPQFGPTINNCAMLSSTSTVKSNPLSVEVITVTSAGLVDTILGANYPVHSVFGGTVSNGGEIYNPQLNFMSGKSFLRLGAPTYTPYNHHAVEKTFSVTLSNCLFQLAVLPVMQKGSGSCCDAPSIRVQFFNTSSGNTVIPCPSLSLSVNQAGCANPSTMDFTVSPNTNLYEVYYGKWRVITVDLTPYIGSTIGCRIGSFYCATGCSKFSYAYLDAQCGPMEIKVNGSVLPAHTNSVTFQSCGVTQATITTPPHFSSYQWSGPAGFSSTLSTITTSASGVYTLSITPVGTCSTITKFINISVFPAPSVSVASSRSVICKGETVKITATGLSTYSWNVPGTTGTINVSPAATFTYNVNGFDANGCPGRASIIQSVNACQSLGPDLDKELKVVVFPNPTSGEFTVELDSDQQITEIEVTNALGQVVYLQKTKGKSIRVTLNERNGVYIIKVKGQNNILYIGRVVLQ